MTAPPPTPLAGWYPDPAAKYDLRFWDGSAWTDRVRDASLAAPESTATTLSAPPPVEQPARQAAQPPRAAPARTSRTPLVLFAVAGLVVGAVAGFLVADDSSAVDREKAKVSTLEKERERTRAAARTLDALAESGKLAWPTNAEVASLKALAVGDCIFPDAVVVEVVPCGAGTVQVFAVVDDFPGGADASNECRSQAGATVPPSTLSITITSAPGNLTRLICAGA